MTEMLALDDVSKRYTKDGRVVHALANVSFRVTAGEFVAIVGPSGSGKSTLMNVLGLLDRPDEGTYRFEGREVGGLAPDVLAGLRNARIGFVFQAFHLLPRTPAVENVELPLVYSDRSDVAGLAHRALARVGLADRATHLPSELSGGQQQRVAIARALVNEPDLILADEPTGNLDSAAGQEVMDILQELNGLGTTVVLVTHDLEVARAAQRRIRMVDGAVVEDVPVRDRRPARTLVPATAEA